MQERICFYQIFRIYANKQEKELYNCKVCKHDDLNLKCKYYKPVNMKLVEIIRETTSIRREYI